MDRVRNARHFAPRLQRWLSGVGALLRDGTPQPALTSPQRDNAQLELFAQEFFAALEPGPPSAPPGALFKAAPAPPLASPATPRAESPSAPPAAPHLVSPAAPHSDLPGAPHSNLPGAPTVAPRAESPDAPPLRRIQLGAHALDYQLRRSTRRSIGFMIDDSGLRVTAPKRITLAEIDNAIRAKQRWILTKLHERGERRALRQEKAPLRWVDGAALPFMGADITLRLEPAARSHCVFDAGLRELRIGVVPDLAEWQLQERVRRWLHEQARRVFDERLALYAARLGVRYASLTLSSAGTRWGSCTVGGSIRLNWRLIHFSLPLIDYVVAHELAHLREMNHSPRFWATVASVYPDYDGAKAALRKQAQELPVLFPA